MMQNNGFAISGKTAKSATPVIKILQLQNNNIKLIEYDADKTSVMMDAALDKVKNLLGRYSNDFEPYAYFETSNQKYRQYDDLARRDD